jgi:hypothetical protein
MILFAGKILGHAESILPEDITGYKNKNQQEKQ